MLLPGFKLLSVALLAVAGALLVGCAGPAPPPGDGRAPAAPVWQEPTLPPAATATTAPEVLPTDTPPAPIHTPARPTYTPRPAPTRLGEGERQSAPAFQAVTLDGTSVYLEDTLGTPTLLAFWAPW